MEWPPDPDPRNLDPEVLDLLVDLADAALSVPRAERRFLVRRPLGRATALVHGCGLHGYEVAPQDLVALDNEHAIDREHFNTSGSYQFFLTQLGYRVAAEVRAERGEPIDEVEPTVTRYVEASGFVDRHPEAARKLRAARALLVGDATGNATRIGHDCREAMMAFAADLASEHAVIADTAATETVARVRAVLDRRKRELGARTTAMLDALLTFWGTASDLAQRQEHGASKEGEPLGPEDARRVVFYSALVMYELDRL